MKKIFNKFTIVGLSLIGLFILLMILLVTVDKKDNYVGEIGLYHLNKAFLVQNYEDAWDGFSDVILYVSLAFGLGMAIYGLYELIKTKSLFKVDKDILLTGAGIIVILLLWLIFDKAIAINFRPIIINGKAQGSFPSTHVMFTTFLLLASARMILKRNKTNIKYTIAAYSGMSVLVLLCAVGRILSCMHWMTDVLGGLFIGIGLYFLVIGMDKAFSKENIEIVE